jgi:pyridoxine/pyridoxamine 5'-phosphate oxidase
MAIPLDLESKGAPENPMELLQRWAEDAVVANVVEPMYVTLATSSSDGRPSSRTVQVLEIDDHALLLTTNMSSRKGKEILATGRVAITFYWREMAQAINLTGDVAIADSEECDERFSGEERRIKAARVLSRQGQPLVDREALVSSFESLSDSETPIERPSDWVYYRIIPDSVSFWSAEDNGINRRLHYALEDDAWRSSELYP